MSQKVLPKQVSWITIQAHEISRFLSLAKRTLGEGGGSEQEKKRNAKSKIKAWKQKTKANLRRKNFFSEEISLLFPFLPFLMNRLQWKNGPVSIHQVGVPRSLSYLRDKPRKVEKPLVPLTLPWCGKCGNTNEAGHLKFFFFHLVIFDTTRFIGVVNIHAKKKGQQYCIPFKIKSLNE